LRTQPNKPERVFLDVDGRYIGALSDIEVYERRLAVGLLLDADTLATLQERAAHQSLLDATLHYVSFRPRSEQELRRYLRYRGASDEAAEAVVADLRPLGQVDDEAFARFWMDNRQRFRPRGERLVRSELRAKGVTSETLDAVEEADPPVDQEELAVRAAQSHVRRLQGEPWLEFRRKLTAYLLRRGFDYGIAGAVTKRLWEGSPPDDVSD